MRAYDDLEALRRRRGARSVQVGAQKRDARGVGGKDARVAGAGLPDLEGEVPLFDTFAKIATQEGPPALWRGFIPMWARIAPTTTLQLLFFEKFSKLAGISAT